MKFSFNDGAQDSEINVEAPAMLRIFPDATGKRWQWDVFKLQAAANLRRGARTGAEDFSRTSDAVLPKRVKYKKFART